MCSQYFLELKMLMEMEDRIDYLFELELQKRITYYPSNQIPVIKMNNNQLTGDLVKWGYRLFDNKLVINAKSETLNQKALFKNDLINHRCIIPATGFYEWDEHKQRFSFENPQHKLLFMAGIYREFNNQKEVAIITTNANESMENIHSRMPLIFNYLQMIEWLENKNVTSLLKIKPESLIITSGNLQTSLQIQ